jgi:hypothetical protein
MLVNEKVVLTVKFVITVRNGSFSYCALRPDVVVVTTPLVGASHAPLVIKYSYRELMQPVVKKGTKICRVTLRQHYLTQFAVQE